MNLDNIQIPVLGDDADVKVEGFSIKGILNVLIDFINKILKFEF